ncbi:MAG: right-handed parallel beta-helix repeat-containing protein [Methanobacteriota archaeon]
MSSEGRRRKLAAAIAALLTILAAQSAVAEYDTGDDMDIFIDSLGNKNMVWRESVNGTYQVFYGYEIVDTIYDQNNDSYVNQTINANIVFDDGYLTLQNCIINGNIKTTRAQVVIENCEIYGNVNHKLGSLVIESSNVSGNVDVENSDLELRTSYVNGNVKAKTNTDESYSTIVTGNTVNGNVDLKSGICYVVGNTIDGNLKVKEPAIIQEVSDNIVSGNTQLTNNTSGFDGYQITNSTLDVMYPQVAIDSASGMAYALWVVNSNRTLEFWYAVSPDTIFWLEAHYAGTLNYAAGNPELDFETINGTLYVTWLNGGELTIAPDYNAPPDLQIVGISADKPVVYLNSPVTITLEMGNAGNGSALYTVVNVTDIGGENETLIDSSEIGILRPGTENVYQFNWTPVKTGIHYLKVEMLANHIEHHSPAALVESPPTIMSFGFPVSMVAEEKIIWYGGHIVPNGIIDEFPGINPTWGGRYNSTEIVIPEDDPGNLVIQSGGTLIFNDNVTFVIEQPTGPGGWPTTKNEITIQSGASFIIDSPLRTTTIQSPSLDPYYTYPFLNSGVVDFLGANVTYTYGDTTDLSKFGGIQNKPGSVCNLTDCRVEFADTHSVIANNSDMRLDGPGTLVGKGNKNPPYPKGAGITIKGDAGVVVDGVTVGCNEGYGIKCVDTVSGTRIRDRFSDGSASKVLTYYGQGSQTISVSLPKDASVGPSCLSFEGEYRTLAGSEDMYPGHYYAMYCSANTVWTGDAGNVQLYAGWNIDVNYSSVWSYPRNVNVIMAEISCMIFSEAPFDPKLDVGNDGSSEWLVAGRFSSSVFIDDTNTTPFLCQQIQDYIDAHSPDENGMVLVPLKVNSNASGIITLSDLNISYMRESKITGCEISNNLETGIYYEDSNISTVDSQIHDNGRDGIFISNSYPEIESVTVTNNKIAGINVDNDNLLNPWGLPASDPGNELGYFVWLDETGWHLRWSGDGSNHAFNGTIEGIDQISSFTTVGMEYPQDSWSATPLKITFSASENNGQEGFDFLTESEVLRFDLWIDGARVSQKIYIGTFKFNPATVPFNLTKPLIIKSSNLGANQGFGLHLNISSVVLMDSTFDGNIIDGVEIIRPPFTENKPTACQVINCTFKNNGRTGIKHSQSEVIQKVNETVDTDLRVGDSRAGHLLIEGCHFSDNGAGTAHCYQGYFVTGYIKILNNTFSNTKKYNSLFFEGVAFRFDVQGNSFEGTPIGVHNSGTGYIDGNRLQQCPSGIFMADCTSLSITNNTLEDLDTAISLGDNHARIVMNNTIMNCTNGISHISGNCIISSNRIVGRGAPLSYGFQQYYNSPSGGTFVNFLYNNTISGFKWGMHFQKGRGTVGGILRDNIIKSNTYGIVVENGYLRAFNNTIQNSTVGLYSTHSDLLLMNNTIEGNGIGIKMENATAGETDYTCNQFTNSSSLARVAFPTGGGTNTGLDISLPKGCKINAASLTIDGLSLTATHSESNLLMPDSRTISGGDLDGDGDIDLLEGYNDGANIHGIRFLYNDGEGDFTSAGNIISTIFEPWEMELADFTGDGLDDILVLEGGYVFLYANQGNGMYERQYVIVSWCKDIVTADFDEDGDIDTLCGFSNGTIWFYRNNGDGTFENNGKVADIPGGMNQMTGGSFIGSSKIDIVAKNGSYLFVLEGVGGGAFGSPIPIAFVGLSDDLNKLSAEDFDDNGIDDIILLSSDSLRIFTLNESHQAIMRNIMTPALFTPSFPGILATDPFDSDARVDLIMSPDRRSITTYSYYATRNVKIDVGADNAVDWAWVGNFTQRIGIGSVNGSNEFAQRLQDFIDAGTPDYKWLVHIPFAVHSDAIGSLSISELDINYTVGARMENNTIRHNEMSGVVIINGTYKACRNEIYENHGGGINLIHSSDIVADNNITANDEYGINVANQDDYALRPVIANNTVMGNEQGINVIDASLTIKGNDILSNRGPGIYLENSKGEISLNVIINNHELATPPPLEPTYTGIKVRDSSDVQILHNNISYNTGNIYLYDSDNITIEWNEILDNAPGLIQIYPPRPIETGVQSISSQMNVSNNTVYGCVYGLHVVDAGDTTIIRDNAFLPLYADGPAAVYGLLLEDASVSVGSNLIFGMGSHGIFCNDYSDAAISDNTILNCGGDGIHCSWASPVIVGNAISDNYGWGIYCEYASTMNAGNDTAQLLLDNPLLGPNGLGRCIQYWALEVLLVESGSGIPVSGELVNVRPLMGAVVASSNTDANGFVTFKIAQDYADNDGFIPVLNPYIIDCDGEFCPDWVWVYSNANVYWEM